MHIVRANETNGACVKCRRSTLHGHEVERLMPVAGVKYKHNTFRTVDVSAIFTAPMFPDVCLYTR